MRSSAGEHLVDIEGVTGSIPVASTIPFLTQTLALVTRALPSAWRARTRHGQTLGLDNGCHTRNNSSFVKTGVVTMRIALFAAAAVALALSACSEQTEDSAAATAENAGDTVASAAQDTAENADAAADSAAAATSEAAANVDAAADSAARKTDAAADAAARTE